MNKRIEELAEQAGFDVKRLLAPYPGGFPREDFLALESFAQLIVQECADWAARCVVMDKAQLPQDPHSVGWNSGVAYASQEIKKHFGVEE